jgi:hypothetical protein
MTGTAGCWRLQQLTSMVSANGEYQLNMQGDGNLVEYFQGRALWASGTQGHPGAWAAMQGSDGNLCVYSSGGTALWCSQTQGHPGAWAVMQNDSNFVIYDAGGTALWVSRPSMAPGEDPVAISYNGQFHVFARNNGSGNLLHAWWDGSWHVENLGGVITGPRR